MCIRDRYDILTLRRVNVRGATSRTKIDASPYILPQFKVKISPSLSVYEKIMYRTTYAHVPKRDVYKRHEYGISVFGGSESRSSDLGSDFFVGSVLNNVNNDIRCV